MFELQQQDLGEGTYFLQEAVYESCRPCLNYSSKIWEKKEGLKAVTVSIFRKTALTVELLNAISFWYHSILQFS
ncbi:hypothetical protein KSS87_023055 [Heliosperma pusillum]|nr:hypothetical protein KSS87_023055 [Heliosperma pusillum]